MRRCLLLVAAVPLLFAPPVFAGDEGNQERGSPCRVPGIDLYYDTFTFGAEVSLPATGCASREHSQFVLSTTISRLDNRGGRNVVDRSVMCGPFRSADDMEPGDAPPRYSCDMHLFLDHPEVEDARYDVDVSYPGASAQRSTRVFTYCISDGRTASCDG